MMMLCVTAAGIGLAWLALILGALLYKGLSGVSLSVFTEMTPPPGDAGGLLNAIYGSIMMTVIAVIVGTPIGVLAGTYMAEYGRFSRLTTIVRFINDILLSAPSIVLGLFVYAVVVVPMGHFSGFAGAIALAFIALPVIVRTTDEMLRLVPVQMREAALSLGVPQWKLTFQILIRAARSGIITGVLLALARISGETAPLLFTAYSNQFWSADLNAPMANAPMAIFQYAMSPYESWNAIAWAGAFVVTLFVLALSLVARAILLRNKVRND